MKYVGEDLTTLGIEKAEAKDLSVSITSQRTERKKISPDNTPSAKHLKHTQHHVSTSVLCQLYGFNHGPAALQTEPTLPRGTVRFIY